MSYLNTLNDEIEQLLDTLQSDSKPLHAQWITHEICGRHKAGLSKKNAADRAFWEYGGYAETRERVRKAINKRTESAAGHDNRMATLPGFEHLQNYYMVKRGGDDIGLPISELTDAELDSKAAQYRAMADSCLAHALEIERYKKQRTKSRRA